MIDAFGRTVLVAYSEVETLWIQAANSLSAYDRSQAIYDISQMSGRTVRQIREKANELRQIALDERWLASTRSVMTARPFRGRVPSGDPSTLKQTSTEAKMGSKAVCRYTRLDAPSSEEAAQ